MINKVVVTSANVIDIKELKRICPNSRGCLMETKNTALNPTRCTAAKKRSTFSCYQKQ